MRISEDLIKEKAKYFADLFGIPRNKFLKLSSGWVGKFKERHGLKSYRFHGEAGSVNKETVNVARARIQKELEKYAPRDRFNMDETGLFFRKVPDRGLATQQMSGLKADKTRITLAFTVNADGSEHLPPLFIGHAQRPRCFNKKNGKQLGFDYHWNSKAWMRADIFQMYVSLQFSIFSTTLMMS